MEYKIRIAERRDDFTPSDLKIADYILKYPETILSTNTNNLAELTKTSQSAIIRFIQKIGYNSYLDFKLDIAKSNEDDITSIKSEVIGKDDDISDIISKSKNNVLSSVEKTYVLIDENKVKNAVDCISKSNSVYLTGVASSGLVCEDFLYKLQRAGKRVIYERDAHTNLSAISNITPADILICISYSGKTKEILTAAKYAKEKGSEVISITKSQRGELANSSDILLLVPEIEKEMRLGAISSRFSSLIITDILYYGYVSRNMEEVIDNLKISKNLTNRLK